MVQVARGFSRCDLSTMFVAVERPLLDSREIESIKLQHRIGGGVGDDGDRSGGLLMLMLSECGRVRSEHEGKG
jgi:hypothetical protein